MRLDDAIQQNGQKEKALIEQIFERLHVALPGEVISYDDKTRTAKIQPVLREWRQTENPPVLMDVPVFFPGGIMFTVSPGDECLVIFADACIDGWFQNGGINAPVSARRHDLSDGFALVGFSSSKKKKRGSNDILKTLAGKKNRQAVVRDPIADGEADEFIDSLSQDSNGVIVPTKKKLAISHSVAPAFRTGTANDENTYVTHNGKLYFLPEGHEENTDFSETEKTVTTVMDEIIALRERIEQLEAQMS